jgi:hypothetical protein
MGDGGKDSKTEKDEASQDQQDEFQRGHGRESFKKTGALTPPLYWKTGPGDTL